MSKNDMLAPIIRALVGVPSERLGVILDTVNKIGGADGELWRSCIAKVLREGVRSATYSPEASPNTIEQVTINALKQLSSRYPVLVETKLLKPVAKATVPARTKPFEASEFYQTGTKLYIHRFFADRLDLNAKQTVDSAPERPYVVLLLKANAYHKDIRKELPETHLSTLEDIAGFIEAQPGGKSGLLLNNGHTNIFYVKGKNGEVFVIDVFWNGRQWVIFAWELGEFGPWFAGCLVLCPGNAVL